MGSASSIISNEQVEVKSITLKKLPEAIEESIFIHEKFPYIIDPTEQAARFLKYQMGSFILADDVGGAMSPNNLNRCLVGALQYGRTMTVKFPNCDKLNENIFDENLFPIEVLDRLAIYKEEIWSKIVKPNLGDPELNEFTPSQEFVFVICITSDFIPPYISQKMHVIKVEDTSPSTNKAERTNDDEDPIADLYGASEVIRNSTQLVEAGFDGDLDELKSWIDKGYHIESVDGRKHSALSEASCQGHLHVVKFLIDEGANPNSLSDTDRSPLWRASFNSHYEVVSLLLNSGADPDIRDKISGETAYDVAQDETLREIISTWDRKTTEKLIEIRNRQIMSKIEERIKTTVEREAYAKMQLNKELVAKAEASDIEGIKEILLMVAEEAEKTSSRPRITAECRNTSGQSLLSIAAQKDDFELASFLLSYWKTCDKDRWDLVEGEISVEAKTFKTSPNTRDLKGWTCVCIAVFHNSLKVLQLLLEHGGDPNIRSSYNKNAWDLAKDDMDAAEHVVKSRADIRKVIQDFDTTSNKKSSSLFGNGKVPTGSINMYQDLNDDGSAFVMNVEMNKSLEFEAQEAAATTNTNTNTNTKSSKNVVNKTSSCSGTKKANKKKK